MILGLDTSCYTTSAALYDGTSLRENRRLLRVESGQKGLRQSDALFQHIKALPEVLADLGASSGLTGVAASSRPRDVDSSYMPCFLAGFQTARSISALLRLPLFEVSHQQGHLAAALLSADCLSLAGQPFLAWHVSGGTTELLLVHPFLKAERIGGTTDACAGQIIDRIGVRLGLGFPAGPAMEALAADTREPVQGKLTVRGAEFSLSGLQNQAERLISEGHAPQEIATFTLKSIARVLRKATDYAMKEYPGLPVVGCGGVLSNAMIRRALPEVVFASPAASADNATGVASIGWMRKAGHWIND